MMSTTKEGVVGGLYVMWRGNPHMSLGKLVETFAGAEGFEVGEIPDSEWPQREWRFCPWCGGEDLATCMDPENEDGCLHALWE
ncbi:MAG: hypothetical protein KC656_17205 [Myxococcales bacterium]|nr:hypothetical protein [Myxococcales bacterium]MCB9670892.1 hypothetical protein [Alphaproteobacteria bacterium]MCB9691125.1 hypothetical protein [Alphaproteobacteria bacterium]